jgi:hypothetical protein
MKSHARRRHVSLRREYTTTKERQPGVSVIRSLEPLVFFADSTDLDVESIHVFADLDEAAIALGFVLRCGTVNVKLAEQAGAGPRRRP